MNKATTPQPAAQEVRWEICQHCGHDMKEPCHHNSNPNQAKNCHWNQECTRVLGTGLVNSRPDSAPQPDHVPAPVELQAATDAALGLVELPPIRVDQATYEALKTLSLSHGLIIQATVREAIKQMILAADLDIDSPEWDTLDSSDLAKLGLPPMTEADGFMFEAMYALMDRAGISNEGYQQFRLADHLMLWMLKKPSRRAVIEQLMNFYGRATGEPFEQAWARMEAKGFRYGHDALEQVRFGFQLARGKV